MKIENVKKLVKAGCFCLGCWFCVWKLFESLFKGLEDKENDIK